MLELTEAQVLDMPDRRMRLKTMFGVLGVFWAVWVLDTLLLGHRLFHLGIHPRGWWLPGIVLAPFLHGSFYHVLGNSVFFVLLGFGVMRRASRRFWALTVIVVLVSGVGTWLFGQAGSVHGGASGVVFGYWGFLLTWLYYEKRWGRLVLSGVLAIFISGELWAMTPFAGQGISWEGHLFGALGGVFACVLEVHNRGGDIEQRV